MMAQASRGWTPVSSDDFARSEIERAKTEPEVGAQGCAARSHSDSCDSSEDQVLPRQTEPGPGRQCAKGCNCC